MPSSIGGNQRTAYLCALLRALATLSSAISVVPRLRLIESNICRSHYQTFNHSAIDPSTGTVPEELCKIAQVQTNLAFLLGWDSFFQNIPVFIVGIVYSILSERIDRHIHLLIVVTSNAVAKGYFYAICYFYNVFDVRLIWATSLFDLIGGGKVVFDSLTVAMIAEAVPTSSLTHMFYYLTAVLTALRMLGVSGGSYLLGKSLWLPITLGYSVWCLMIPTSLLLRTRQYHSVPQGEESEGYSMEEHLSQGPPGPASFGDLDREDQHETKERPESHNNHWLALVKTFRNDALMHKLPLSIFVTHELAMGIRDIGEQWMSKRYAWPIRTTGYILAAQTLLSAIILASLPKIGTYVARKREITAEVKDVFFMKCSLAAAAAGTAMIAFALSRSVLLVGLAVFAFGIGFHDALKSYVTAQLKDTAQVTRIYMWISILEVVANMINGPFWASMYALALRLGGLGLGLPFLVCSGGFLGTLFLLGWLK